VAEVPEGGTELERILGRAPGRGLAVGHQAGDSFVKLLGEQCRAQFDDALDLAGSGVSLRVGDAGGDDDGLTRRGYAVLAVEGEVGFARDDGESLFLVGWMFSVITPPGTLRQLKRTSCPWLSSAMAVYSIHSPVAGLKKGRKPVTGRSARDMIIGPSCRAGSGVDALINHRCTLGRVGGRIKVGRIRLTPVDPVRQLRRPVPRHHPDAQASSR
jgi:hypothetical protein